MRPSTATKNVPIHQNAGKSHDSLTTCARKFNKQYRSNQKYA